MSDLRKRIQDKINEDGVKKQKVFHSSFSSQKVFDKNNTFKNFDMEKFGAFHGACDLAGNENGRQIAENRTFVKILEDANMMIGLSPQFQQELITENGINFKLLEEKTGYKVKGDFENPIMIEAEVSYKKALTLNENRTGQWNPYDIVREVMNQLENGEEVDGFSDSDLDDYYDDNINLNGVAMVDLDYEDYGGESYNQEYKEFLFVRDWLESKGYDAIKYENKFEGNSECIMSFRPENIEVTDSYCLKHLFKNDDEPKQKNKSRVRP